MHALNFKWLHQPCVSLSLIKVNLHECAQHFILKDTPYLHITRHSSSVLIMFAHKKQFHQMETKKFWEKKKIEIIFAEEIEFQSDFLCSRKFYVCEFTCHATEEKRFQNAGKIFWRRKSDEIFRSWNEIIDIPIKVFEVKALKSVCCFLRCFVTYDWWVFFLW